MTLEQQAMAILQVVIAALLSMLIGMERESAGKPAGLRTHMLTGIGACLFTILSLYAFGTNDTTRIASNIVTGVGFLGAGVIIQRHGDVHDLTTAASIWSTAAVGMAVGSGAWLLALGTALIVWIVLRLLYPLSRWLEQRATQRNQHSHG